MKLKDDREAPELRHHLDMTEEGVTVEGRQLQKLVRRERARLEVSRWQESLLSADKVRKHTFLAIPGRVIRQSEPFSRLV